MKIERKEVGDATVLTFAGEFDAFNLPDVRAKLDTIVTQGKPRIVFNLHGLKFINSSAIEYLIKLRRDLDAAGGELVLSRPSKFFHSAITTLGIERIFKTFETDEDALDYLQG